MINITEFESAVQSFLGKNGLSSVEEIVTKGKTDSFLATPDVLSYMTRPASGIAFDKNGEPLLESKYERAFYKASQKIESANIPYRASTSYIMRQNGNNAVTEQTTGFYDSGAKEADQNLQRRMLYKAVQSMPQDAGTHIFAVSDGDDPYQIGGLLRRIQGEETQYDNLQGKMHDAAGKEIVLPKDGTSFLVFPTTKDNHAITIMAAIDNPSRRVLRVGFINSVQDNDYNPHIIKRINQDSGMNPALKPFEIVDCSHNLQTGKDDYNCTLYSKNFSRGLTAALIQEPELRKVFADSKADPEHISAQVKNAMYANLPEYYDMTPSGYQEASKEHIRSVHLQSRWEVGNAFLKERADPLGYVPEANNERRPIVSLASEAVKAEMPSATIPTDKASPTDKVPSSEKPYNASSGVDTKMAALAAAAAIGAGIAAFSGSKCKDADGEQPKKKWSFTRIASTALLIAGASALAAGAFRGKGDTWAERVRTGLSSGRAR